MTRFLIGLFAFSLLISCSEKKNKKVQGNSTVVSSQSLKKDKKVQGNSTVVSNQSFFYPYDTVPKIYQYRELKNGMYEQFHRVYGITRTNGKHILLEIFTQDGRLTETYDFLLDKMVVDDHFVVGATGDIQPAVVNKNKLFPLDGEETHFNSQFSGVTDAFVIDYDSRRRINAFTKRNILSKKVDCMKLIETLRVTNRDDKLALKNETSIDIVRYYGKSIGLVEWHDVSDKQHYILEDIITQNEWLKIISG